MPEKVVNTKKKRGNTVLMDESKTKPSAISYFVVFLGLGWMITVPVTLACMPFIWTHFKIGVLIYVFVVLLSAAYTVDRAMQPAWCYRFGAWVMDNCTSYFSFKIEFEDVDAVENTGPALFAIEPHGVLPVSVYWGSLNLLKKHKMLCCLSSSILTVPIMKHILTWTGAVAADKKTMLRYLSDGYSLNICPGGVQEVAYLGDPNLCVLFLRSRFGFTKLALEEGRAIVPAMTFGLQNAYDYWVPKSDIFSTIGRKLGFFPMIFLGLGGVPFFQAKPCPLAVVVGSPIIVPKTPNPSVETIAKYHALFVGEMERLFEENKVANGMGHVKLEIK
jgi:diacylglycerol O-acyltransferase 2, plant